MDQHTNLENPQSGYGYPQGSYQAQYETAPVVTTKEWLLTMLIMIIPIANIVMMFIYAFGGNTNPSKANYFKAALIWAAIGFGLWLVFFLLFVVILGNALSTI